MLVIQIALGIVLAVLIIAYLPELLALGVSVFFVAVAVLLLIGVAYLSYNLFYNYIGLSGLVALVIALALFALVHKVVESAEKSSINWKLILKRFFLVMLAAIILMFSAILLSDGETMGSIILPTFFVYPCVCWYLGKHLEKKYPRIMFGDLFILLMVPGSVFFILFALGWL